MITVESHRRYIPMEDSIGKRIMHHRKNLGFTQDQLAEKLGVTAQAVSKWENDQSCPDISMLVTLSDIFGITTDALLGKEPPVHQAEIVTDDDFCDHDDDNQIHTSSNWNLQIESGRHWALCFALWVLGVGIQILFSNLQNWDLALWSTLWTTGLALYGLFGLLQKFSFFSVGCFFFGSYFMLDNLNLLPFSLNRSVIFPVVLILFGLSLTVDALKKPKKSKFRVTRNGKSIKKIEYNVGGDRITYNAEFADHTQEICMDKLRSGTVSGKFGDFELDFTQVKELAEDCHLEVSCSFGDMTLIIPQRFEVKPVTKTSFGEISFDGHPDANPQGVIQLDATANFSDITIEYA